MKVLMTLLLVFNFNLSFGVSNSQTDIDYKNYIDDLTEKCEGASCCLKSVSIIKKNNTVLFKDLKDCKKRDLLRCRSSYSWCSDRDAWTQYKNLNILELKQ